MQSLPGTAYVRPLTRANGSAYDDHVDCHPVQRRQSGGTGWKAQTIRYVPLALILLAFILAYTIIGGWISVSSLRHGSSNSTRADAAALQQPTSAVAAAVAQLQQQQELMLSMLQTLTNRQQSTDDIAGQQLAQSATDPVQHALEAQQSASSLSAAARSSARDTSPRSATGSASDKAEVPAAIAALPLLTKLHNAVLRQSKDFEHNRRVMKELLDQLVHMPAAAAQTTVQQQLDSSTLEPVQHFIYELYRLMLSTGKLIPCREDTTLVLGDTISSSSSSDGSSSSTTAVPRYYFATNLRDNSIQLPHYTLSLLQTLLQIPRDSAFVSVYESNSDDGVQGWVDVMQLSLNVIGTYNRVVTRGLLVRNKGQHRIEFLAQVRNMALSPLYSHYARASDSSSSSSAAPGVLPWDPDYVIFINDVYFCWSMVLRLMNYRADITCGTDWWQNPDATMALPAALKKKSHKPKPVIPQEYRLETPMTHHDHMSPDQNNPIVFYDVWVARDIAGQKFWWTYPFISDKASSAVVSKGLPVRASCCWNGLTVLNAAPFKQGLKFRMHQEGECRASECTLLCDDFARLGYTDVVVDTGVQLAYDWDLAREMMAVGIEGVGQSTWSQVKTAGISQHDRQPGYQDMECCGLKPGAQWVSFFTDCYKDDVFKKNYTQSALHSSKLSWA